VNLKRSHKVGGKFGLTGERIGKFVCGYSALAISDYLQQTLKRNLPLPPSILKKRIGPIIAPILLEIRQIFDQKRWASSLGRSLMGFRQLA
jgi:hypothetical protein